MMMREQMVMCMDANESESDQEEVKCMKKSSEV